MNLLHHLAHLAAVALGVVGIALGGAPGPVATGSISAGMQAGPACIERMLHPGDTATVNVSVSNPNRSGWEKLDMSEDHLSAIDTVQYEVPPSWVSFTAPGQGGWVGPGRSATSQITVAVPGNARRGRYGGSPTVTAYAPAPSGSGTHIGAGAASATFLEFSVGMSPPPHAFCDGSRASYWPQRPLLPVCKAGEPPIRGRQAWCRVLPLPPPVANAKNCHVTAKAWAQYMRQLDIAAKRYGTGRQYAHCWPHGSSGPDGTGGELVTRAVYRHPARFGWPDAPRYRWPDVPPRFW